MATAKPGIGWMSAVFLCLAVLPAFAADCPAIDFSRFWIPADMDHMREIFLAKAKAVNESGTCVVDGWYGRTYGKFYLTIVTRDSGQIGKVISFTEEELKK